MDPLRDPLVSEFTHHDICSELLVHAFKPRCNVHRIAHGRIVELRFRSHVSDDAWPRVDPHSLLYDNVPMLLPSRLKCLKAALHFESGGAGVERGVGGIDGGGPANPECTVDGLLSMG